MNLYPYCINISKNDISIVLEIPIIKGKIEEKNAIGLQFLVGSGYVCLSVCLFFCLFLV